jgi:hypothetical protein
MHAVVNEVQANEGRLITFSHVTRYDETPMRVRIADLGMHSALRDAGGRSREIVEFERRLATLIGALGQPVIKDDVDQGKLLEVESSYTLLVFLRGHYCLVRFDCVVPVASMARTTAEVYYVHHRRIQHEFGGIAERFERRQRVVCTDGDGAVAKSERAMALAFPSCAVLHTICAVHGLCNDREAMVSLVPALRTKLTHTALTFSFNSNLAIFRKCFRAQVLSILKIERNRRPSDRQQRLNAERLEVFLPSSIASNRVPRAVILACCGSSFDDPSSLVYFAGPDESDTSIEERLVREFTSAMVGSGPKSFPSRNWIRAELTPNWVGLLESVCGLFSSTFTRFKEQVDGSVDGATLSKHGPSMDPAVPLLALMPSHSEPGAEDLQSDGVNGASEGAGSGASSLPSSIGLGESGGAKGGADDWTEKQRNQHTYRNTVFAWISGGCVLADCILLAAPLAYCHAPTMRTAIYRSGAEWERKERLREIKNCLNYDHRSGNRDFRLSLAFEGAIETELMDKAAGLMKGETHHFELVPLANRSRAFETKAFCVLARSHAHAHKRRRLRTNYPFKVFGALKQPALFKSIDDEPCKSRYCQWTRRLLESYGSLQRQDAQMDVRCTAEMARDETVQIEHAHGYMRRFLVIRSEQGRALDMESVNDAVISRWFRKTHSQYEVQLRSLKRKRNETVVEVPADEPPAKKRKTQPICAWNVLVQEWRQGSKVRDISKEMGAEMSAAYKCLSEDEFARLETRAADANFARKHGNPNPLGRCYVPAASASEPERAGDCVDEIATSALALLPKLFPWAAVIDERRSLREAGAASASNLRRDAATVASFYNDPGHGGCDLFKRAAHVLNQAQANGTDSCFLPEPCSVPTLLHMQFYPQKVDEITKKFMSLNPLSNCVAQMRSALGSYYSAHAMTLQHEQIDDVDRAVLPKPTDPKRLCHEANMCLCSGEGLQTRAFKCKFEKVAKCKFPAAQVDNRKLLANSGVVISFFGGWIRSPADDREPPSLAC